MRGPPLAPILCVLLSGLALGCPKAPEEVTAPEARPLAREVVVWSRDLGVAIRGGPLLVDGVLYLGDDAGTVSAIEARSGREIFTAPLRPDAFLPILARPAAGGGSLFVADSGGRVAALDPATGAPRWTVDMKGAPRAPLVTDGRTLWVASAELGILALDAATGEERWRRVAQQRWTSLTLLGTDQLCARGFTDPEENGLILCLDRERGWERWRQHYGRVDGTALIPLDEGRLLASRQSGSVEIYGDGGRIGPERRTAEGPHSEPLLTEDALWLGVADGTLRRFGLTDLSPGPVIQTTGITRAAPARVCQEIIAIDVFGGLSGYDADQGRPLWRRAETLSEEHGETGAVSVLEADGLVIAVVGSRILGISPPSCPSGALVPSP